MMEKRYNHLNDFYKKKFGQRVLKIPLDGGFTCPNRDGKKSYGGCIFCSNRGSGDRLIKTTVSEQINNYFSSFKKDKANAFLAYFQNYSSTYKNVDELKNIYDEALKDPRIVGLDIATRCDCINEDVVSLLKDYQKKYYVQVELGLQSANEKSHKELNQCITNDEFIKAVKLLNDNDIDIVIHVMVGLPNETHQDIVKTVDFLNSINYSGIKIHSTYVEKNTKLCDKYMSNEYTPISYEEYMDELIYIISSISPKVIIHRITGDPFKDTFVAPNWMMHKKKVTNHIERLMIERNIYQGSNYKVEAKTDD